jgi:hypothetical protein
MKEYKSLDRFVKDKLKLPKVEESKIEKKKKVKPAPKIKITDTRFTNKKKIYI